MSGRDDDEHVGYPMNHLFRRRNGDADDLVSASEVFPGDSDVTPVDLAAVQADDALLNALGRADVVADGTDAELARVLVAWRREVDTESIGQLVDIDTAAATIRAGRKSATRRHPVLAPVAAAAAVLVVAFAGISLVARSAEPGDQLFALTKALYAQYAQSVEAAKRVETELGQADRAIREGNTSEAQKSLNIVEQQLPVVNEAEGRERLATDYSQLVERLERGPESAEPTSVPTSVPSEPQPSPSAPPSEEPVTPSQSPTTPPATSPPASEPSPTAPNTPSSSTAPAEPEPEGETRPVEATPRDGERSPPAETAPGS